MKTNIRKLVFETNSSSTHSLTMSKDGVEGAMTWVKNSIREAYESQFDQDKPYIDIDDYIHADGTLYLKGFYTESGHESSCVYYIISSWMSKIQYMAMVISEYAYYQKDYDKDAYLNDHLYSTTLRNSLIEKTELYKLFVKFVKKQLKKFYDGTVKYIKFCPEEDTYIECIEGTDKSLTSMQAKEIISIFENMMDPDYSIIYSDIAYSPYDKPEIHVI